MKVETTIRKGWNTKTLAKIGVLSAVSIIIMLLSFPLPIAPSFYKLDFSEVPVLVGAFAMGPVAGVVIEAIKILLNFATNGTTTGGIGELANFLMGVALVLPAALIYRKNKSLKSAIIGLVVGIICLAITGALLNYYVLIPMYSKFMSIDKIIGMGAAINGSINSITTFVLFAVVPFNLVKGLLVSLITMLIYKKISPVLHK